ITPVVREKTVGFVIIYIFVLCIGTLAVTLTSDCSLLEAAYEFASALGTVGVSNGLTGPDAPAATLYIEMFGMFLGRLEIIMVFAGMYFGTKSIWRKIRKTT
ncbi:MAG: potassium transporter TrkG, partial [Eubacteriales bacterium]|nr:potassium transporter TrkG [Eubacteriales bacterium]